MPISIDPPPGENEIECARCGAHVYIGLSRCPNCGVNLYEPDDNFEGDFSHPQKLTHPQPRRSLLDRLGAAWHGLTGRPYRADEVFGDALDQAGLYNDLLGKVGGDAQVVERLIESERRKYPQATRKIWLQEALRRWDDDHQNSAVS